MYDRLVYMISYDVPKDFSERLSEEKIDGIQADMVYLDFQEDFDMSALKWYSLQHKGKFSKIKAGMVTDDSQVRWYLIDSKGTVNKLDTVVYLQGGKLH